MCVVETHLVFGIQVDTNELVHIAGHYQKNERTLQYWDWLVKLGTIGNLDCAGDSRTTIALLPPEILRSIGAWLWNSIRYPPSEEGSVCPGCELPLPFCRLEIPSSLTSDDLLDAVLEEDEVLYDRLLSRRNHLQGNTLEHSCAHQYCQVGAVLQSE